MMMKRMTIAVLVGVLSCLAWAVPTEILVDLRLDETSYVVGERVRGVVEVCMADAPRPRFSRHRGVCAASW